MFNQACICLMPANSVMHLIWQAGDSNKTEWTQCTQNACVQDLRPFWSVCPESSAVGSLSESWDHQGPASLLSWTFSPATGERAFTFHKSFSVYHFPAFLFIDSLRFLSCVPFFLQRDWHERSDPGKRATSWPPHL